jgi:D-sedoheptulose 7-phosphate isomerase
VGGGNLERIVSPNLVAALKEAKTRGLKVFGIVGRDGGYTAEVADECVVVPVESQERVTVHTEGMCAVLWHLLVSHPALQASTPKWESIT